MKLGEVYSLISFPVGKPITNKVNVGIRLAVLRDRWNLHHRDIRLKQFLGKGKGELTKIVPGER